MSVEAHINTAQAAWDELRAVWARVQPAEAACPPGCDLKPGHNWDSIHDDGRHSRKHGGAKFGPFVDAGFDEYSDAPGVFVPVVQMYCEGENFTEAADLEQLVVNASAGLQWLRDQA